METNVLRVLRYLDKNWDTHIVKAGHDLYMDQQDIRVAIHNINKHFKGFLPKVTVFENHIYTDIETDELEVAMKWKRIVLVSNSNNKNQWKKTLPYDVYKRWTLAIIWYKICLIFKRK